jgi:DNA polymerase beta
MSDLKIKIQLKTANQISGSDDSKPKISIKKKISLKPKVFPEGPIDLAEYFLQTQKAKDNKSQKDKIIEVLEQLIDHTENRIKASTGDKRKSNMFRATQFKKAVASLRAHPFEITSGAQAKQLKGIGPGIAKRIDEIVKTGTLVELDKEIVIDDETRIIKELNTVTGIGDSHAKKFYEQGVTGVDDLREKAQAGEVKITHHMEVGLDYYYDFQTKIPFDEVVQLKETMMGCISTLYPKFMVEVCGSHRRQKAESGDIDVLMCHPEIKSEEDLIYSSEHYLKTVVQALRDINFVVADLTSQGDTKYMGVCIQPGVDIGRRIDIRFVPYDCYYPALLYFTGSMMTNKLMRTIALERGYTLNEYGLYHYQNGVKGDKVVVHSEKEVFDILKIKYLEPNEREL